MLDRQDLMAMSESDYMNDEQLKFFTNILTVQKEELLKALETARLELTESDISADPNDVASSQEIQQLKLSTANAQNAMLKDINKALDRINNDEYGYCEVSGEPIGIERLLAKPTATLSIYEREAKEHRERTQGKL